MKKYYLIEKDKGSNEFIDRVLEGDEEILRPVRRPPFYPCVVGRVLQAPTSDPIMRDIKKIRNPHLFKFDPVSKELVDILPFNKGI